MKPIIVIDGFTNGFLDDITIPARNGFNFGAGIDIHRQSGFLQVSPRFDEMTIDGGLTGIQMEWMVQYGSAGTVYGLNSGATFIHRWASGSSSWGTIISYYGSSVSGGMTEFNNKLYWATNDDLGNFDGTTWTNSGGSFSKGTSSSWPSLPGGSWHPMAVLGTKLCVGDGNFLYTLDTDGISKGSAIAIPAGELIKCSAIFNNLLYFGTVKKNVNEGKIYSWNGFSPEPELVGALNENGIHALKVWKNRLMIFSGLAGNLYEYNGASLRKVKTIPGVDVGSQGYVRPGAVIEYNGNLLFGLTNILDGTKDYSGIFSLGNVSEKLPEALTFSHIPSTGTVKGVVFYSLAPVNENSQNLLFLSYQDASQSAGSAYLLNKINLSNRIGATSYFESQIYDISDEEQKRQIKGVELVAKSLASGNSVVVKYKKDNASAWTTLGTVDSANQDKILMGQIGVAKNFQVRLDFTASTTSPEISAIKVY